MAPLWTHNDWHASNLLWQHDAVSAVLDFGLSDRTSALHDLATAIERNMVRWLDLPNASDPVDYAALDALLEGYQSVTPLQPWERKALAALLPVVHVEFALGEADYFLAALGAQDRADLAYETLSARPCRTGSRDRRARGCWPIWRATMSPLEIVAVIFSVAGVWLTAHRKPLCWPVSLVSVALYAKVFLDAKLYSDLLLQGFFRRDDPLWLAQLAPRRPQGRRDPGSEPGFSARLDRGSGRRAVWARWRWGR